MTTPPAALISYQEDFAIANRLAKSDSGNARWRDLAVSYSKLADAYVRTDQPSKAREALATGRAIIAHLVEQFPNWFKWERDLSEFDQKIAALKN